MKITIVIPVYNEADFLGACLETIAAQSIKPYEVIVVDNNSADSSSDIAGSYSFVKLIKESKQGVTHARTRGFDESTGDIIARIDADSLLPDNWVETLLEIFKNSEIDAVTGSAKYYGIALSNFISDVDLHIRRNLSFSLSDVMYLWGANMAVRRSAWEDVKSSLCTLKDIHEDFDLAIHLQQAGFFVGFDENLVASVSSRRVDMRFIDFMKYVNKSPTTYKKHGINVNRQMYPIVGLLAVAYLPGYILYKGFDPISTSFNFKYLLNNLSVSSRVDPTVNVAL
jgi:glycosyltransferase involved in cell wall biosynthesis